MGFQTTYLDEITSGWRAAGVRVYSTTPIHLGVIVFVAALQVHRA